MTSPRDYVPTALREQVAEQARHRCGYCLRSEELMGMPMTLDHIIPRSVGGATTEDNLWLACRRCNEYKGVQTDARDPQTGERMALFNPRRDTCGDHFAWNEEGVEILGKTARGRATVLALQMNNPEIIVARRLWVSARWWPPPD